MLVETVFWMQWAAWSQLSGVGRGGGSDFLEALREATSASSGQGPLCNKPAEV